MPWLDLTLRASLTPLACLSCRPPLPCPPAQRASIPQALRPSRPPLWLPSLKHCAARALPFVGGEGYHDLLHVQLVQKYNVSVAVAKHLAHAYGTAAFAVCELARPIERTRSRMGVPTDGGSHVGIRLSENYPYIEAEVTLIGLDSTGLDSSALDARARGRGCVRHVVTASLPHCLTASLPHCITASLTTDH